MDAEDRRLYEQYQREVGGEEASLLTGGLLSHSLQQIIPMWLEKLLRMGLTGGKDRSPVDVPQEPGAVLVEASNGRKVWIRPDAYREEDGRPRAEVREHYSRTDGAIWAMLAVLEGGEGEGVTRDGKLDECKFRKHYEIMHGLRDAREPIGTANERLLTLALATAQHHRPDLDALPEPKRREVVVAFASRLHAVAKATRELQEHAERGRVDNRPGDPARDVRAAELRCLDRRPWAEIGQELGIDPAPTDEDRDDNQNARKAAKRGLKPLNEVRKLLGLPLLRLP